MLPNYPLILASASVDGAALTNTTSPTSILPASGIATIQGGAFQLGSKVRVKLMGRISTLVTSPGTLTLDLRLGGNVISSLGAMALNVTAQTNETFIAELIATIRALGSGTNANAICHGEFRSRAIVGSAAAGAGGMESLILPESAPAVGGGFDSTIANKLDVFATWSVASASNSIQVHDCLVDMPV